MPNNSSVDRALAAIESDPSKLLGIRIQGTTIAKGQFVPRADAEEAPVIAYPAADPATIYMVVSLDLDEPWKGFGPFLHWIQPGFKAGEDGVLTTSEPFVANWVGPAPPPDSAPHRYTFYLLSQPASFDGSKYAPADGRPLDNLDRIRYSLDDWIEKTKSRDPVAANYFMSN